jgi:hypothetical protein
MREGEAPRGGFAILGSQWPGRGQSALGEAHRRMVSANVMFVGRPPDRSDGKEGGVGIRRVNSSTTVNWPRSAVATGIGVPAYSRGRVQWWSAHDIWRGWAVPGLIVWRAAVAGIRKIARGRDVSGAETEGGVVFAPGSGVDAGENVAR